MLSEIDKIVRHVNGLFYNINRGGCGVFASILAKELDELDVRYEICVINYNINHDKAEQLNNLVKTLREQNNNNKLTRNVLHDNGVYIEHVMLRIEGKYVDSTGVHKHIPNSWGAGLTITTLTKDELHEMANTTLGWNNEFNRNQIKGITRKMKEAFTILKQNQLMAILLPEKKTFKEKSNQLLHEISLMFL